VDLSGVTPQRAMHAYAPVCAGLHDRLRRLRGKVQLGAADGLGAGGKTGVSARTSGDQALVRTIDSSVSATLRSAKEGCICSGFWKRLSSAVTAALAVSRADFVNVETYSAAFAPSVTHKYAGLIQLAPTRGVMTSTAVGRLFRITSASCLTVASRG
jgi:hypothetical protein